MLVGILVKLSRHEHRHHPQTERWKRLILPCII